MAVHFCFDGKADCTVCLFFVNIIKVNGVQNQEQKREMSGQSNSIFFKVCFDLEYMSKSSEPLLNVL